jgi:hypothetical protein
VAGADPAHANQQPRAHAGGDQVDRRQSAPRRGRRRYSSWRCPAAAAPPSRLGGIGTPASRPAASRPPRATGTRPGLATISDQMCAYRDQRGLMEVLPLFLIRRSSPMRLALGSITCVIHASCPTMESCSQTSLKYLGLRGTPSSAIDSRSSP